jgi:hypothetical protein
MNDIKRFIAIAGFVVFLILCSINLWWGIGFIAVLVYFMGDNKGDSSDPWQ